MSQDEKLVAQRRLNEDTREKNVGRGSSVVSGKERVQ